MKLLLPLMFALLGCNSNSDESDGDIGPPPPPKQCEGYLEMEPNDDFDMANYVALLPALQPETLCGKFYDYDPFTADKDYFFFFLNPNPGAEEVIFNFVVKTEDDVVPAAYLYQTIYDELGVPQDHQQLGIFYGVPGELVVLDFHVPYHFLDNNDLYLRVDGIYPTDFIEKEYSVQYWNF